jgi:hypothetical protein
LDATVSAAHAISKLECGAATHKNQPFLKNCYFWFGEYVTFKFNFLESEVDDWGKLVCCWSNTKSENLRICIIFASGRCSWRSSLRLQKYVAEQHGSPLHAMPSPTVQFA